MKKNSTIEVLRWVAVIAVMLQHATFERRYSGQLIERLEIIKEASAWCVTAFFAISGFLSKSDHLGSFFIAKAKRLLIPYVCVSFCMFALCVFIDAAGLYKASNSQGLNFRWFLWRIFMLKGFGPQFYFLPYLFIVSVGWLFLSRFCGSLTCFSILALVFGFQCVFLGAPEMPLGYGAEKLIFYALAYGLGALLAKEGINQQILVQGCVIGFIIGLVLFFGFHSNLAMHFFAPVLVYLLLNKIPFFIRQKICEQKLLNPAAIYLWHCPILLPVASVLLLRVGIAEWPNLILACICTAVGSQAINYIVKKGKQERLLSL